MSLLTLEKMTVRRGECPVVDGVSLRIGAGEVVGLIGPNGAGKTSLLRGALGLLAHEGHSSLGQMPPRARAKAVAFLPQGRQIAWPITVEEVVALGRSFQGPTDPNHPAVRRAIAQLGLEGFRRRQATALSGGEQARVLIARALAQDTPLLFADEPGAGLDPEAQIRVMTLFEDLAKEGRSVLVSIHDLGLAARHCTRLVLLHRGRIMADGPPRAVLTEAHLAEVFGIRGYHAETEDGPIFQPLGVVS